MGRLIDTIAGFTTNNTALTTATIGPPDANFIVRGTDVSAVRPFLSAVWGKQATNGAARIISPALHDFVNALRFATIGTVARDLLPETAEQRLIPQDPLVVQLTSGAADSSVIVVQIYYRDIMGFAANLLRWEECVPLIEHFLGVLNAPTGSATIGTWAPGRAINADADQFKPNTWYAVLGALTDTAVGAISIRGSGTSNTKVGMPGTTEDLESRDFFVRMSVKKQEAYIPVFNSADRSSFLVDVVNNAASPAPNITFNLAQLRTAPTPVPATAG